MCSKIMVKLYRSFLIRQQKELKQLLNEAKKVLKTDIVSNNTYIGGPTPRVD